MALRPTLPLAKSKSGSSRQWLARQFSDPYVRERMQHPANYRSRAVFKLVDLDAKLKFLGHADVNAVIDLGAAPGGWSQFVAGKLGLRDHVDGFRGAVAARRLRADRGFGLQEKKKLEAEGTWSSPLLEDEDEDRVDDAAAEGSQRRKKTVIAVDLLQMRPIHGVQTVQMDFTDPSAERVIDALLPPGQTKVDVILSDMAANTSGNKIRDAEASLNICSAVYRFAKTHLRTSESIGRTRGGVLVLKHFANPLLHEFRVENLNTSFQNVLFEKPDSSRSESSEGYWVCMGWKGGRP